MSERAIVAVFPTSNAAYDAASAIRTLAGDKAIDFKVKAGAMFSKDAKGNIIPLEEKDRPLWGTLAGGLAGGLIGLVGGPAGAVAGSAIGATAGLATDTIGAAFDTDFVQSIASDVRPGDTAVVVEANENSTEPVDAIVRLNGGRIHRSELN